MTVPVIEFNNLSFAYNSQMVLENITLAINTGEIAAIVGPNGSGKTTLLRLALGLLKPSAGSVQVLGSSPAQARSKIGYVPQRIDLDRRYPITVQDVVLMGRIAKPFRPFFSAQDRTRAREALEDVGLEQIRNAPFFSLSGGQQQRVLIARALCVEPQLLLLDEPTANVDKAISRQIYDTLKTLSARTTIVFVSHDINFVASIVSTVICIDRTIQIHHTGPITDQTFSRVHGEHMAVVRHDQVCDNKEHHHG
jgi:zinc transport system ATP-binding protein